MPEPLIHHMILSDQNLPADLDKDNYLMERNSQDKEENAFGRQLLEMCSSFGLCILNGACNGDFEGHYTYVSDFGCSVIDYYLISEELFYNFISCSKLIVAERIESKHLPIELFVNYSNYNVTHDQENSPIKTVHRLKWNHEKKDLFLQLIKSQTTKERITHAMSLIKVDINKAMKEFNNCLLESAKCMEIKINSGKIKPKNNWFDEECRIARQKTRKLLRTFRKSCDNASKSDHDKKVESDKRHAYHKARREYKNLLHQKKKQFKEKQFSELLDSFDKQQNFWKTVNSIVPKQSKIINNISIERWFQHFSKVLESTNTTPDDIDDTVQNNNVEENDSNFINSPITREEIHKAIRSLKNNKAAGPDGIIGEIYKYASDVIIEFFYELFNELFDKGIYPEIWTESIIQPLHKKGDPNDPNNFRGIFLSDISGKLYSHVINQRLQLWTEMNNILGEHQAGFRKEYSTVDHIFTLLAIVQKQLGLNRKLYVAFIDFEKAFDSISRNLLWPILQQNGIHGKLFRVVKSMYENIKVRIRAGVSISESINCLRGVKQGDVCSPVLFSLFINELAKEIHDQGKHGATLNPTLIELFILLFADDIILLSETAIGLQNQLNTLYHSANRLQLKVNLQKSNIIVFRKGGYLSVHEKWNFGQESFKIVNGYKYLGLYFTTKLSIPLSCKDLASSGKKAVLRILSLLGSYDVYSIEIFKKLFDTKVQPILLYASEVWGLDYDFTNIEKIHLFAFKRFLGVSCRTPNAMIYGDTGRYPLRINAYIRTIKYWIKLTRMNQTRIPYQSYLMLKHFDERGKQNWVSKVRSTLFRLGFGYVWQNQGVDSIDQFIKCCKQRLIDCNWQNWNESISLSERYSFYRTFKTNHEQETYFTLRINKYIRNALVRLRFGISDIAIHSLRYKFCVEKDKMCVLCNATVENEVHFILCCPYLNDLRQQFIPEKFYRRPCMFRLVLLLSTTKESLIKDLATFLYLAFKRRSNVSGS